MSQTLTLLQATEPPPLQVTVGTVLNEVDGLPQRFALVLDDYHLIGGQAVDELLSEFCTTRPGPCTSC